MDVAHESTGVITRNTVLAPPIPAPESAPPLGWSRRFKRRPDARTLKLLGLLALYVAFAHLLPRPQTVTPEGWRLTAVFFTTVAGLMLQPLPGASLVVIGLTLSIIVGGLPMNRSLAGFASPSVWLVLAAMLVSKALKSTWALAADRVAVRAELRW